MLKTINTYLIATVIIVGQSVPVFAENKSTPGSTRENVCSFVFGFVAFGGVIATEVAAAPYLPPEVLPTVHASVAAAYGILRARGSRKNFLRTTTFMWGLPLSIIPLSNIEEGSGRFFLLDVGKAED